MADSSQALPASVGPAARGGSGAPPRPGARGASRRGGAPTLDLPMLIERRRRAELNYEDAQREVDRLAAELGAAKRRANIARKHFEQARLHQLDAQDALAGGRP